MLNNKTVFYGLTVLNCILVVVDIATNSFGFAALAVLAALLSFHNAINLEDV